jgi:hypothetical protein
MNGGLSDEQALHETILRTRGPQHRAATHTTGDQTRANVDSKEQEDLELACALSLSEQEQHANRTLHAAAGIDASARAIATDHLDQWLTAAALMQSAKGASHTVFQEAASNAAGLIRQCLPDATALQARQLAHAMFLHPGAIASTGPQIAQFLIAAGEADLDPLQHALALSRREQESRERMPYGSGRPDGTLQPMLPEHMEGWQTAVALVNSVKEAPRPDAVEEAISQALLLIAPLAPDASGQQLRGIVTAMLTEQRLPADAHEATRFISRTLAPRPVWQPVAAVPGLPMTDAEQSIAEQLIPDEITALWGDDGDEATRASMMDVLRKWQAAAKSLAAVPLSGTAAREAEDDAAPVAEPAVSLPLSADWMALDKTPGRAGGDCLFHALEGSTLSKRQVLEVRKEVSDVLLMRRAQPSARGESMNALGLAQALKQRLGLGDNEVLTPLIGRHRIPDHVLAAFQACPGLYAGSTEIAQWSALPRNWHRKVVAIDNGYVEVYKRGKRIPLPQEAVLDPRRYLDAHLKDPRCVVICNRDAHWQRATGIAVRE